jgi:alpha-L-arabinofuranosidase
MGRSRHRARRLRLVGPTWRQTIFWPFAQWSNFGSGTVLQAETDFPAYDATYFDPRGDADLWFPIRAPFLKLGAVETLEGISVFALNRHLEAPMPLALELPGFGPMAVVEATTLADPDLKAVNTRDAEPIRPRPLDATAAGGSATATLPPASWSMIRLRRAAG